MVDSYSRSVSAKIAFRSPILRRQFADSFIGQHSVDGRHLLDSQKIARIQERIHVETMGIYGEG